MPLSATVTFSVLNLASSGRISILTSTSPPSLVNFNAFEIKLIRIFSSFLQSTQILESKLIISKLKAIDFDSADSTNASSISFSRVVIFWWLTCSFSFPFSIFRNSSSWLISVSKRCALFIMPFIFLFSAGVSFSSSRMRVKGPTINVNGVRSSCETFVKNSNLKLLSSVWYSRSRRSISANAFDF